MKKWMSLVLCLVLGVVSISGCASEKEEKSEDKTEEKTLHKKSNDSKKSSENKKSVTAGSNIDDAALIPTNTKVFGAVKREKHYWYCFTTSSDPNDHYAVTLTNNDAKGEVKFELCDEFGENMGYEISQEDGIPASCGIDKLEAKTEYFIHVYMPNTSANENKKNITYSIMITNLDEANEAHSTSQDVSKSRGTKTIEAENVHPGKSPDDAGVLPANMKVEKELEDGEYHWYSFTTGPSEETTYTFTTVNTAEKGVISVHVYDMFGIRLGDKDAEEDGAPVSISSADLLTNTTYYAIVYMPNVYHNDDLNVISYSICVEDPNADSRDTEREELVFEVPFEINETQIAFVADKAEFADRDKAVEALKPVAEAMKQCPDHSILISGTTATIGDQKECVELSKKRAEAVKKLLVEEYDINKKQIKTKGLGFELDPFVRGNDVDADGKFIESEAVKNRRVVIVDAEDPIAKEILEKE